MRQILFFLSIGIIQSMGLFAQVGINTLTPGATLEVTGEVLVRQELFLEDPGKYLGEANSNLLVIMDSDDAVVKYDIVNSKYGPLNYVQFVFENLSQSGLMGGYNTKISATEYTLAVHGYYWTSDSGATNVSNRSNKSNGTQFIEGPQFYAYVDGGTWWIKGFLNDSKFYIANTASYIDLFMDVMIYRNNFITKIWSGEQVVDMAKSETATASLPSGF